MKQRQLLNCNKPLQGPRVELQRLHTGHVHALLECFKYDDFWLNYRANQKRNYSNEQLKTILEYEYSRMPSETGKIEWLILKTSDSDPRQYRKPVGLACLSSFDSQNSRAEFLIGFFDKASIGTGVGLEASLLVLDYAFNQESLHKLVSFVYSKNLLAQRNTLSLGFEPEGLLVEHFRLSRESDYADVFQNRLLVRDFRRNKRLSRLSIRLLKNDVTKLNRNSGTNVKSLVASFELK